LSDIQEEFVMQKIEGMSFSCKDIGINCSYEINESNSQEPVKKLIDHAETTHSLRVLSADVIFKVQNAKKK
jgi:predicted small metal-binding protein